MSIGAGRDIATVMTALWPDNPKTGHAAVARARPIAVTAADLIDAHTK